MINALDNAIMYAAWRIACLFKFIYDDGLHVWKSTAITTILLLMPLGSLAIITGALLYDGPSGGAPQMAIALPTAIIATIFAYLFFDRRWDKFAEDFSKLSSDRRRYFDRFVVLAVLIDISTLIFSYYVLSQCVKHG